jgi:hypothetical protein
MSSIERSYGFTDVLSNREWKRPQTFLVFISTDRSRPEICIIRRVVLH